MDDFEVIFGTPSWSLNGVNVFGQYLVQELRRKGQSAHVLETHPDWPEPKPLKRSPDVPFVDLPVGEHVTWEDRYRALEQYLIDHAPCVFLPNHDFEVSGVCPALPGNVVVVGIVHSDDPEHYDHVSRLGKSWDAIVGVSQAVAEQTRTRFPDLASRVTYIPYGVDVPTSSWRVNGRDENSLNLVYAGRLIQHQKRIFDLIELALELDRRNVEFHLRVAGDGRDARDVRSMAEPLVKKGRVTFEGILDHGSLLKLYDVSNVILLTSSFEGLPMALLEAMARGNVPVTSDIESGIPELVEHKRNGFRVPVGEISLFADRLQELANQPELLEQMSVEAFRTIRNGAYNVEVMASTYMDLFKTIVSDRFGDNMARVRGRAKPPPDEFLTWKDRIPRTVRRMGSRVKRWLRSTLR